VELVDAFTRAMELRLENHRNEELEVLLEAAREHEDDQLWVEIAHWYAERGWRRPDVLAVEDFVEADKWTELALTKAGFAGVYARRGEFDKAEAMVAAALVLDKELPEAHVARGEILIRQDRWVEASESLAQALVFDRKCARAYVLLSEAAAATGALHSMDKILDLGAKECADDDGLLMALSARYEAQGDSARAVRALNQAAEFNPENARVWCRLARFAAIEQNGDRMREAMEKALTLDREGTLAWIAKEGLTVPELNAFGK